MPRSTDHLAEKTIAGGLVAFTLPAHLLRSAQTVDRTYLEPSVLWITNMHSPAKLLNIASGAIVISLTSHIRSGTRARIHTSMVTYLHTATDDI